MENRKDQHVAFALQQQAFQKPSAFDDVILEHVSLPHLNVNDVDISTSFAGLKLSSPLYINAMTGGSEKTKAINEKLAEVAKRCHIPIASGSLSSALKDPSLSESFTVLRDKNPNGLIFANIGAEYDVEAAKRAVSLLQADALQIHLNVIQEIIMHEGDRDFSMWKKNIEDIVKTLDVPVIVKEVGFGMSAQTFEALKQLGVKTIDVSGKGGTNFAQIENDRYKDEHMSYMNDMGITTVQSLKYSKDYQDEIEILASGGIRNPLDVVKALAMGAKAVGISGLILKTVEQEGVDKTVALIKKWEAEIKLIMVALDVQNINDLRKIRIQYK